MRPHMTSSRYTIYFSRFINGSRSFPYNRSTARISGSLIIHGGRSLGSPLSKCIAVRSMSTAPSMVDDSKTEQRGTSAIKVGSKKNLTWERMLPRLEAYYKEHGHSRATEDPELRQWVRQIRNEYKWQVEGSEPFYTSGKLKSKLSKEKMASLEAIDFPWTGPLVEFAGSWENMFPRLEEYYEENGHSDVDLKEDVDLAVWVTDIRHKYRHQMDGSSNYYPSGKRRLMLSPEKLVALNLVEFPWAMKRTAQTKFEDMLDQLKAFKIKHGHAKPSSADDPKLSQWVNNIRCEYQHQINCNAVPYPNGIRGKKQKFLPDNKFQALDEIGFPWIKDERDWAIMIQKLRDFYRVNGHSDVMYENSCDRNLVNFVMITRHRYRHQVDGSDPCFMSGTPRPTLSPERFGELREVEFDWKEPPRSKIDYVLDRLQSFHAEHGHMDVTKEDDKLLFGIIKQIRSDYRHQVDGSSPTFPSGGKRPLMTDSRLQMLNDAGFPWFPKQ